METVEFEKMITDKASVTLLLPLVNGNGDDFGELFEETLNEILEAEVVRVDVWGGMKSRVKWQRGT